MPTYQYACTNAECGNRFELVQSFTDPAAAECPTCAASVRKVYGAVGVVFKGSGFYRTDSRSGNGKPEKTAAAASSSSSSGEGASSSSDSSSADSSSGSSSSSSSSPSTGSGAGSSKVAASA